LERLCDVSGESKPEGRLLCLEQLSTEVEKVFLETAISEEALHLYPVRERVPEVFDEEGRDQ